jgi:site-specific DNA-methyltransferase (adenine-specific)
MDSAPSTKASGHTATRARAAKAQAGATPKKSTRGKGLRKPIVAVVMPHTEDDARSTTKGALASGASESSVRESSASAGAGSPVHAMGRGTFASAMLPPLPTLAPCAAPAPTSVIVSKQFPGIDARVWVGDCRDTLSKLPEIRDAKVDLVFADPPFNWNRAYDKWDDAMDDREYLDFTRDWLDLCIVGLRPGGQMWVNIPDDWAAEIALHLKARKLFMNNWCVWHYRFGQNTTARFINSKVHALNFVKPGTLSPQHKVVWNPHEVLELSDRAAIYGDKRTLTKEDGMPPGLRVPMDVWYGPFMGRVQGNNKERRGYHDNQLPEAYLERVIRSTSNPSDLVLDPFLGSGTTGVMALALGRRFVGTEFSAKNAKSACERIEAGPVRAVGEKPTINNSAINQKRKALLEFES